MEVGESWMTDPVPETFELADGVVVPLAVGQRVYNYYDMKPGTIGKLPTYGQPFTGGPKGTAWWCDVIHDDYSSSLLDGSRLCTIKTAIARGYHTEEDESKPHAAYLRYKVQQWAVVNATDDYYTVQLGSLCVGGGDHHERGVRRPQELVR
jgi:hypothetical protein